MAGMASDESGVGKSLEGVSSGQNCQSSEALVEWRCSEQVENGSPSTSPPYWDSDDDHSGREPPSKLYGKYTWRIDKFSQINKRELRSNAFEVGGQRWYILIYPQGCDVCNHLSLFLCVANHDKLLPGWSHFAQFTIAVVNKDPKKTKYSDTLHRFWKKEHDWGWKKFMELSKVLDGFIDADTLTIKAQVQVIKEQAERPFRCLDVQYRRELIRVYLTNVEQICRRFVEERRSKLGKLIEDKARWSSFRAFWLGIDQDTRHRMSRAYTDMILKVIVKHFFIEKEVTSSLVMDSLYSGLKALEGRSKSKKCRGILLEAEELPIPIVRLEKDMFILVDDVLLLLERASVEPLPPKDDKGPQNRTKDGTSGEDFNKDSIERDERHLTELGRRTIEIFVLAHIFSKIEVAYQEAVALRRQEELIREEAAWLAESEQKAKRGAAEKEKKSKKKQGKQKRNNRKKDKGKDDKPGVAIQDKLQNGNHAEERNDFMSEEADPVAEKPVSVEDASDVFDSVDCIPETLQPDSEDRDVSPVGWDTDTSEVHTCTESSSSGASGLSAVQNGGREISSSSVVDDSSSTCSTDSVPSVVINGPYRGSSFPSQKGQKSPSRGKNHRAKETIDATGLANGLRSQPSEATIGASQPNGVSARCKAESESDAIVQSFQDQEDVVSLGREQSFKDQADMKRSSRGEKALEVPSSPSSSPKNLLSPAQVDLESKTIHTTDLVSVGKPSSDGHQRVETSCPLSPAVSAPTLRSPLHKAAGAKPTEKPSEQQVPVMSRPLSAPVAQGPKQTAPAVPMIQTTTPLARSVSAAGRLSHDPSPATSSYLPQSYRNAIIGAPAATSSTGFTQPHSPCTLVNSLQSYPQSPMFLSQSPERIEPSSVKTGPSFGGVYHELLHNGPSTHCDDIRNLEFYQAAQSRSQDQFSTDFPACTSGRQTQGTLADEFPHLDIINDLLDDEHVGKAARASTDFRSLSHGPCHLNRHFSFPGDIGMSNDMGTSTSSCRFERTLSYPNEGLFQHGPFDMIPQATLHPYVNGHIDGSILNQWQMDGSDLPFLGMGNAVSDGYPYHVSHYPELACSASGYGGYSVFRPSNGH